MNNSLIAIEMTMNESLLAKGNQQIQAQDYLGAIATLSDLIQGDPFYCEAFYRRGVAYFHHNQIHLAVSDYGKTLELDSNHAKAYYGRALARLTLKNPIGALKDVNEALRLAPDYARAFQLRASITRRQADFNQAIADYKQAAKLYLAQRKADNAKACIDAVTEIQAHLQNTRRQNHQRTQGESWTERHYFDHVMQLIQVGNTQRALADINWVIQANAQDGKAYGCRGLVYLRKGDARSAIGDFNQAIAFNYAESLIYRSRAQARLQLEDYAGAVQDCNQALSLQTEALSFVIRGNAHRMMQDQRHAIEDYDAALAADPNCGEAHLERGMTYESLKEFQAAMVDYQQAISLFCTAENWMGHRQAQVRLKVAQDGLAQAQGQDKQLNRFAQLYQRLLEKVGNNQTLLEAILKRKKERYPGRPEEWYLESAIEDLDQSEPNFWGRV